MNMNIKNIVIIIVSGTIALYGNDTMSGINIYSFGMFPFVIGISLLFSETFNIIKEPKIINLSKYFKKKGLQEIFLKHLNPTNKKKEMI